MVQERKKESKYKQIRGGYKIKQRTLFSFVGIADFFEPMANYCTLFFRNIIIDLMSQLNLILFYSLIQFTRSKVLKPLRRKSLVDVEKLEDRNPTKERVQKKTNLEDKRLTLQLIV